MSQVIVESGKLSNVILNEVRLANETETLGATKVLKVNSPTLQFLDPGGAARNVDLPAEALSEGLMFVIANRADAAEIITVRNDAAGTVCTPTQNETAFVFCDGVTWVGLVGASS